MNDLDNYNIENNILDDNLNNNKSNIERGLPKSNYTKTNNNKTSDIYERFINRVQSINGSGSNGKTDENNQTSLNDTSVYEPLSDEELQFVISPEQTLDIKETNTITSDDEDNAMELSLEDDATFDDAILVSATESNIDSDTKQMGVLKGRQVGSLKLLIIGIVCGLLLSVLTAILLNATGIFATLNDYLTSNNSQKTETSTSVSTASAEPENNDETVVEANDVSLDSLSTEDLSLNNRNEIVAGEKSIDGDENVKSESINDPKQNTSSKTITKSPAPKKNTESKAENIKTDNAKTETVISYEDFAKEAQSTLYREANN
ncbi:hypothetical protein [Psychrobacter sp. S1-30-MNA-CIBAN-0213]|uniref:hypothetical protein n=1 Tax=unclassified Psychrobacter TaxID=196806 RepID=UPI003322AC7A